MRSVRRCSIRIACVALALSTGARAWGAEARPLTAADLAELGGTDFTGGVGDLLLRNDKVEAVVLAVDATADFGIPFTGQALPSRGIIIDAGNRGRRNDQLNEVHHVLNLSPTDVVFYLGPAEGFPAPVLTSGGETASITVRGIALLAGVSTFAQPTLLVTTTYSVTDGHSWINLATTITNIGSAPAPVFSVADATVLGNRNILPFQPFPGRGPKSPPLDLSDPFPAIGVWSFLALPGNNGPGDGPVQADLRPAGEVTYVLVPDSLQTPLVGVASPLVAAAGSFFDLKAVASGKPPLLAPGASLTHERKLVIVPSDSVEAGLEFALPLLFAPLFGGLDARATFTGRVVDSRGNPVTGAHLVFENTAPGSPDFTPLVTVLDENLDGIPDGVLPATGGRPLPMTHAVTDADGRFRVRLQALRDPAQPSLYRARVQAENRNTVEIGPLTVNLAAILGGPQELGAIALPGTGKLRYRVQREFHDGSRKDTPAKLTIYGRDNTDDPDFGRQYLSRRDFSRLSRRDGDGLTPITASNASQLGQTFAGSRALNVVLDHDGRGVVDLTPGQYRVYASRGLEYTVAVQDVVVSEGGVSIVRPILRRVVTTAGYVGVDAHVHSTKSFDASVPLTDRVISLLAAGVDVVVATDHDFITDYAPIIESLGMEREITSIVGNELTGSLPVPVGPLTGGVDAFPEGIGHWITWPLRVMPEARRHGAPADEFVNPATAIDRLRGTGSLPLLGAIPDTATVPQWLAAIQAGQRGTVGEPLPPTPSVVLFAHPRAGLAGTVVIGLFNSLANPGGDRLTGGYDPTRPLSAFPNSLMGLPSLYHKAIVGPAGTTTTGLAFDAMELLNGTSMDQYLQVRRDWFSLLDQGIHRTAFATSDTHRPVLDDPGVGRTYVAVDARPVVAAEVTLSVNALRAFGTTGPFVRFEVLGDGDLLEPDRFFDGIGRTVVATGDPLVLNIRVEAAPWIPVEEVRIFHNGQLLMTLPIALGRVLEGPVLRFQRAVALHGIDEDSYFSIEAGVRIDELGTPLSPQLLETVQRVTPSAVPLAFTNPVFVDRDGNGYVPPGLP